MVPILWQLDTQTLSSGSSQKRKRFSTELEENTHSQGARLSLTDNVQRVDVVI